MSKKKPTKRRLTAQQTLSQAALEGKKNGAKRRLTARDAARVASGYYRDLTETHDRPTLEEIELSENGDRWLVTLGVYSEGVPFGERSYKRLEVDASTGDVLSMKIRPL